MTETTPHRLGGGGGTGTSATGGVGAGGRDVANLTTVVALEVSFGQLFGTTQLTVRPASWGHSREMWPSCPQFCHCQLQSLHYNEDRQLT